jgi:hypothetical protein
MLVRYPVQMALHPEWRWHHRTIPIVFHLVLATFLRVLAEVRRSGPEPLRAAV